MFSPVPGFETAGGFDKAERTGHTMRDGKKGRWKFFNMIVSTGSLYHWKIPLKVLNEIYRCLRPGGNVWIYDGYAEATLFKQEVNLWQELK
jgi:SAM-dependent methyltransferase